MNSRPAWGRLCNENLSLKKRGGSEKRKVRMDILYKTNKLGLGEWFKW
jgi:hypothetical protein